MYVKIYKQFQTFLKKILEYMPKTDPLLLSISTYTLSTLTDEAVKTNKTSPMLLEDFM